MKQIARSIATRRTLLKNVGAVAFFGGAMQTWVGKVIAADGSNLVGASYGVAYQEAQSKAMFDRFAAANPAVKLVQDPLTVSVRYFPE